MPKWLVEELKYAWRNKDKEYIIDLNRQWNIVLNANKKKGDVTIEN